jgi:hypothetical protein
MNPTKKTTTTRTVLALAIVLVVGTVTVSGLNGSLFELGPGLSTDEGGLTNILGDGNPGTGPDWGDIFDQNGNVVNSFGGVASFVRDDVSAGSATDTTVYSGGPGDKNGDRISNWTWTTGNVPAKDDITNAYAYAKTDPSNGDLIIFAGVEREDPSGDSHVDIEFFQDRIGLSQNPPCTSQCTFTGTNRDGDLLVSMDFTRGGDLAGVSIRARREGVKDNYVLLLTLPGEGCNAGGTACAFSNGGSIDGGPWPNFDNHGAVITNLQTNAFTEFGIDVTAVLGFSPCFSTVQVKTRSSQSFTATLKDFQLHAFQQCAAAAATQIHRGPSVGPNHTADDIQGTTVPFLTTVHDKAIVRGEIGFNTPTGTVTFKRFTTANCTGSSTDETVSLTEVAAPTPTSAGLAAAESSSFTPPAGVLSYQAVYNGDSNYVTPVTSPCEPLAVSRLTSAVNTDIRKDNINGVSVLNTAVDAGGAGTTVVDVATITGSSGGPDPTGAVTFRRFTTGNCTGSFVDEIVTIVADSNPGDGIATAVAAPQLLNTLTGSFVSYQVIYNGDRNYDPSAVSKCEPLCAFPFIK